MALLAGARTLAGADGQPPILIRNARIVPVSGPVIAKGSVLVVDGLIAEVGENVQAPSGAKVIAGEGLTVYPGLIDGLSSLGLETVAAAAPAGGRGGGGLPAAPTLPGAPAPAISRGPEDRPLTTPWIKAADLIRPTDRRIPSARAAGFTSAVVFPTTGIFAGQGAVINLAGEKSGDMVVDASAGLYTTLSTNRGGGFPTALMGTVAYIRQTYIDAAHYKMAQAMYAKNSALPRPAYERALEGILEAPRTLMPGVRAHEIDRILRIAAEIKTNTVVYGAHEAFRRAEELKKAGVKVLLNVNWPTAPRDQDPEDTDDVRTLELRDQAPSSAAALAKAGVPFAFSSAGIDRPADILRAIRRSITQGLSASDALRAMTLSAAEIFGVSKRMGSIEKGKIANLTITKGDIFDESSKVQFVMIDGQRFDPQPEEAPAFRLGATQ
jgi:imidazolonepropionase-like amidohydrolase